MSGFLVCWRPRGGGIDRGDLERLGAGLDHRGPHGTGTSVRPRAGFVHQRLWASAEDHGSRQPLSSEDGRLHLVFDGLLGERSELRSKLGLPNRAELPDAALALAAYERWGPAFADRLYGEFAIVVLDEAENRLVLARDPVGARTLFFHRGADWVVVASEAATVAAHESVDDALSTRRLAQFFAGALVDPRESFFAAVVELPRGTELILKERTTTVRELPWPSCDAPVLPRRDEEVAELFRHHLSRATGDALRASGRPAFLLSGGLDSGSIAALARTDHGASPLCVSWVFDELEACDERVYLEAIGRKLDLERREVMGDELWPFSDLDVTERSPNGPHRGLYRRLQTAGYRAAREAGCTVVVSGMFADHLYTGLEQWLRDSLSHRPAGAAFELGRLAAQGRWRFLRAAVSALPRRERGELGPAAPWLTPEATRELSELASSDSLRWGSGHEEAIRPEQVWRVLGVETTQAASWESSVASALGLELRYPFRDARLIDLMLRLPAYQLVRDGRSKFVQRVAMKTYLPAETLGRRRATSLRPLFERGLQRRDEAKLRRLLFEANLDWQRWVRPDWVRSALDRERSQPEELALWNVLSFALWSG